MMENTRGTSRAREANRASEIVGEGGTFKRFQVSASVRTSLVETSLRSVISRLHAVHEVTSLYRYYVNTRASTLFGPYSINQHDSRKTIEQSVAES